jgi:L-amino acid N-acyltransferase YncA
MTISVRDAKITDVTAIATAHVASWQAAYRCLMPDALLDGLSVADREQRWNVAIANPAPRTRILVATHHDGVAGFAVVGPRRVDAPAPEDGELHSIYLHPAHWSKGIGRRLHGEAIASLRELGFHSATLWVLSGNNRAIRFYRLAGWRENGETRTDVRPDGTTRHETQLSRQLTP